jgi:hypothetical protein
MDFGHAGMSLSSKEPVTNEFSASQGGSPIVRDHWGGGWRITIAD